MKKLIIMLMSILMLTSTAFAQANPVITTSTDREICLDVPQGKFVDGVYMAPVRRICEIFNASCDWYADEQMIIINTPDNITRVFLYIESNTFSIFTFTGLISGELAEFELEAPLEIVNDRTLVPFNQICSALKGECVWAEDNSSVVVKVPSQPAENRTQIYLSPAQTDVSAGEEIKIDIMGNNINLIENYDFVGFSMGLIFDKSQFEYVSTTVTDSNGGRIKSVNMENATFKDDTAKAVCVAVTPSEYPDGETILGTVTLRALTDNGGDIKLSNRVYTVGDDTYLLYAEQEGEKLATLNRGEILTINTEAISIK